MNLFSILGFSLDINKSAPRLPSKTGADQPVTEILPSFGTNPPASTVSGNNGNLEQRSIHSDPRELWYLSLPSKLTPSQVLQILRAAIGGDLWQAWQLLTLMLDSWPILRSKSHELREAVSQSKFKVNPFTEDGEEPTDTASEKAGLVRRAFAGFNPNPFTDEEDLTGGIYDFCDAMLIGMNMTEIMWHTVKTKSNGTERYPRALAWVHPRHYTFDNSGVIAVFDDNYNRQYYQLAQQNANTPDPRKFICSQFKSKSGSSLGAGLFRPLAYDWSAVMFNREWMLKAAQTFGQPFVDVTYKKGTQPDELAKLDAEVSMGLANRFIRHVDGTVIEVHPGMAIGTDNAQRHLMELADQHCLELLMGQAGTTKSTPGKLGGKDDSKEDTKRERVEGLARWVATECLSQLARAILLVNYGEESECPTIEADFTEIQDPMEAAQRMQIICAPGMPPIIADEFYAAMKLTKPEPDDQVISSGKIGLLGDTETEINPNPIPVQSPHFYAQGNPMAPPDDLQPPSQDGDPPVQASRRDIRSVLLNASDKQLLDLNNLVMAAEAAPHKNGELKLVKAKLKELARFKI